MRELKETNDELYKPGDERFDSRNSGKPYIYVY